jgi:hypothetical protein
MNSAVWYFTLVCISGPHCTPGTALPAEQSSDANFSVKSCEETARAIAQYLFVKTGDKYGYKYKPVEYEPPNLDERTKP